MLFCPNYDKIFPNEQTYLNLRKAFSIVLLQKWSKTELALMVMDYRYKFNNVLSIINTDISAVRNELSKIKAKFQKKDSGLSVSKDIINKVIHQMKRATKKN